MKVKILCFGIAKEILGASSLERDIADGDKVGDLKSRLCEEYPSLSKLAHLSIAVNEEYQENDYLLSDRDTVALIPPVSGG